MSRATISVNVLSRFIVTGILRGGGGILYGGGSAPALMRFLSSSSSSSSSSLPVLNPPSMPSPLPALGEDAAGYDASHKRRIVNALLYRSKQRGFLELDLLLGQWAEANIKSLDDEQLKLYAQILKCENPDLYSWLTNQTSPPEEVASNPIWTQIKKASDDFLRKQSAGAQAPAGTPWIRGWNDLQKRGDKDDIVVEK